MGVYGFKKDNSEDLQTKTGAKFGGNFGNCYLTGFDFKNTAKEGEEERMAIEVTVKVGERDQKIWFNEINQAYYDGNKVYPGDEGFEEEKEKLATQQNATIVHILKSVGVTEDALEQALGEGFDDFKSYAKKVTSLLPTGFENKPLDVFFEYQYSFKTNKDGELNDKTYPTLPKNMKGGYFIVPAQPGKWKEVTDGDGLHYENDNGVVHPFKRSQRFMEGPKGTQQVAEGAQGSSEMNSSSKQEASWE